MSFVSLVTSRRARGLGLLLALLSVAADCEQCQTVTNPLKGALDRASDAVVLLDGPDGRSYAFIANPELQHLRVFDFTTQLFVFAPNAYFSLSVPVGPDTRRLAIADGDDRFVFALDSAADQIRVVDAFPEGAETPRFTVTRAPLSTGRAPADLAAFAEIGPDDGAIELWVTLPEESAVQVLDLDGEQLARIELDPLDGVAARPDAVVADPLGDSIVVADAELPLVHIFSRAGQAFDRSLDVGGPVGSLSIGVVDVGDGLAPVVLAVRRDAPIVVAIRLFRGAPEERYAVIGSAEIPGIPLVGYVPDQRPVELGPTVCCRELSTPAREAGEATDAWAAVATADGKVTYLSLADGLVRIFDNDLEGTTLGDPLTEDWAPEPGDEDREPTPSLTVDGDFGDPPLVPLLDADEQLTLVWEGSLPGLNGIRGTFDDGDSAFVADNVVDLERRGAEVGDVAIIAIEDASTGCPNAVRGIVDAVDAETLDVTLDDLDEQVCLVGGGDLRVSVAPADAFVVFDRDGDFLGRLAFEGPDAELRIAGAVLTVAPSPLGPPTARGSALAVPINPHTALLDLDLSDTASLLTSGGGGFGEGALLPVAIVGGEMTIPGDELGTEIRARRMAIATASDNRFGTNSLFVCDEAETTPGLCEEFR